MNLLKLWAKRKLRMINRAIGQTANVLSTIVNEMADLSEKGYNLLEEPKNKADKSNGTHRGSRNDYFQKTADCSRARSCNWL